MQIGQKVATKQRLLASVEARGRLIGVLRSLLSMKSALLKMAAGTRTDLIDAQQRLQQEETNRAYDQGQIAEAEAGIAELRRKSDEADKQFADAQAAKLEDARRGRDRAEQDLARALARLDHSTLTSPIDGTVQQVAVTTVGQVVKPGQSLLVVVPYDGEVDVEALVLNKDVGDIAVGRDAVVKLDAFPFTKYGTLEGTVTTISQDLVDGSHSVLPSTDLGKVGAPDANSPNLVFPVTVRLSRANMIIDHKLTPLVPGMTASVEIPTGRRSVLDYLIQPAIETFSQAGHER